MRKNDRSIGKEKYLKKKKREKKSVRIDLVSIRVFWACKKLTTFTWRCTVNAGARENVYEAMLLTRYLFSRGRWFPSLSRDWFLLVHPRNYFLHPLCLFFYLASPRFPISLSFLFPSLLLSFFFFFLFRLVAESLVRGKLRFERVDFEVRYEPDARCAFWFWITFITAFEM